MDWVHLGELILGTVPGALSGPSCVLGGLRPALSASLYSPFIVVFFLLNGVSRVGTCPISPFLQLLGVVVRTEKYGRVKHKTLNVIMAAFPLNTFVVLFCFSTFPAPWGDRECHYQWQVTSSIFGYIVPRRALPVAEEGLFLPATEEGFFPWAGPLAQYRHRHGPTGLLPPTVFIDEICIMMYDRDLIKRKNQESLW